MCAWVRVLGRVKRYLANDDECLGRCDMKVTVNASVTRGRFDSQTGIDPERESTRSRALMSTSAELNQDASILGKRIRNGGQESDVNMSENAHPATVAGDDDSDDDVGPMPMPAEAANGGAKKKRKGAYNPSCCTIILS